MIFIIVVKTWFYGYPDLQLICNAKHTAKITLLRDRKIVQTNTNTLSTDKYILVYRLYNSKLQHVNRRIPTNTIHEVFSQDSTNEI